MEFVDSRRVAGAGIAGTLVAVGDIWYVYDTKKDVDNCLCPFFDDIDGKYIRY